jgi:aminomethyltransferase
LISPRLEQNIALAMVSADFAVLGMTFDVDMPNGKRTATVVERPFFDPNKKIAAT